MHSCFMSCSSAASKGIVPETGEAHGAQSFVLSQCALCLTICGLTTEN